MRVLHLVQKPQRRGAETFAFQLSAELNTLGHEAATVYLYPFDGAARLPVLSSDRCLDGDEAHPLERALGFHPLLLARVRRAIDAFGPHIVQANGARTVKYGSLCRRLGGSPWKLVYRNIGNPADWLRTRRHRLFYKAVMSGVDGVVGVSAATLEQVRTFYDLRIPTRRIPRAISPDALVPKRGHHVVRTEMNTAAEGPVMIFVGSLTPEKRLDRLLRVLDSVRRSMPAVRLWLVGDGPLRGDLERQVIELGLQSHARFSGASDDVASYISAADLLVLSSDTEGVPGVILEAGWLERPAVATDVGGVRECLLDDQTGRLVAAEDETGFADAVIGLLEDRNRRIELGRQAHDRVDTHFRMDRIARQYVEFYRQVKA